MLLKASRQNRLEVQCEGPAEVVAKLSMTKYVVKIPGRRKEVRIYYCNLMKLYVQREAVVNMTLNLPEEMEHNFVCLSGGKGSAKEFLSRTKQREELKESQLSEFCELIGEFDDCFVVKPGRTDLTEHDIELTSEELVKFNCYCLSARQKDILNKEVKRMLELGVIKPSDSEYTSPMILVDAPGKDPRPVVDYRKANALTKDQAYLIRNIEERVEQVSRAAYVTTLDLTRGYWQVPLTERASRYAAFVTPAGSHQPTMMSFGLKNASFCFSCLMDKVLRGCEAFVVPYLDEITVFSDSWVDHLMHSREVLGWLRQVGLTVKAEKRCLVRATVDYLSHNVGQGFRKPFELKISAVAISSQ